MFLDFNQIKMPIDLGIKVPKNDPVRLLNFICEQLGYSSLRKQYGRKWRKYHPETLF